VFHRSNFISMTQEKVYRAIGLMSGTSLDGIDAALIETDGQGFVKPLCGITLPYEPRMKDKIRACFGLREQTHPEALETERLMTFRHAAAVLEVLNKAGMRDTAVDVIGFHGQTLTHDPSEKLTWQIGDGALLAKQSGIPVVNDFRKADVLAGGQGAPFLPLYHQARVHAGGLLEKAGGPIAILNIGGVANVTWIGKTEQDLIAFDTGPGNALMDDLMFTRTGESYDPKGALAAKGAVHTATVDSWMALPFFASPLPKSLDRNSWDVSAAEYLSLEDALATLAEFTVQSVALAEQMLPQTPALWMVTGGGRHNAHLMTRLAAKLKGRVCNINDMGWDGDALEAEGFAYLAVRSLLGLPLSFPKTTGVPAPQTGGVLHRTQA